MQGAHGQVECAALAVFRWHWRQLLGMAALAGIPPWGPPPPSRRSLGCPAALGRRHQSYSVFAIVTFGGDKKSKSFFSQQCWPIFAQVDVLHDSFATDLAPAPLLSWGMQRGDDVERCLYTLPRPW